MAFISPMIRVFFSSTFADFHDERNALQTRVFPKLRQYCLEQGARFLPIDLRWGISEAASTEQYVVRACLEEIQRCQRTSPTFHFVALLGDRYGSRLLPEAILQGDFENLITVLDTQGQTLAGHWYQLDTNAVPATYILRPRTTAWVTDAPILQKALITVASQVPLSHTTILALTTSVTEQEIEAGIFTSPYPNTALCIVRSITNEAVPELFRDNDESDRLAITALRHRLSNYLGNTMLGYSGTLQGEHLTTSTIDAFCVLMETTLQQRIDMAISNMANTYRDSDQNVRQWSFARDRLDSFIGQEDVLQSITTILAQPTTRPTLITGESGIGKTTVLLKVVETAHQQYPHTHIISIFIGGSTTIADVFTMLGSIETDLLATYTHSDELQVPKTRFDREQVLPTMLAMANDNQPIILIVDALDQLRDSEVLRWIPLTLPSYVHLIVSHLPGSEFDQFALHHPELPILIVGGMSVSDGELLLNKWLGQQKRTLTYEQRTRIYEHFKRHPNPLSLRLVMEFAKRWTSWQEDIPPLPETIPDLLASFFATMERPSMHGYDLTSSTLGLIGAGKNGLAEDELLTVLDQDRGEVQRIIYTHPDVPESDHLPLVLWARLYADLEWLLTERNVNETQVIHFYHRHVAEAVQMRYLTGDQGIFRHRKLAIYFNRPNQNPYLVNTSEHPFAKVNRRMVNELAYQQAMGEEKEALRQTLFDAEFLQARIQNDGVMSAVEDTLYSEDTHEIRLLGMTLRLSSKVLEQSPEEIINQLYGRTQGLDELLHHCLLETFPRLWLVSRSLVQAGGSQVRILEGHTQRVTTCKVLPDGHYALSGSEDNTLRLWNLQTGETIRVYQGHTSSVRDCSISPNGFQALSASLDGTLRLWDLQTGETIHILQPQGYKMDVRVCAMFPDGRHALSAASDGAIRIWDLVSGETIRTFQSSSHDVQSCSLLPDGRHALFTYSGTDLHLWDLQSGTIVRKLSGHLPSGVKASTMLPDDHHEQSGADDATLRLWDLQSKTIRMLRGHSDHVLTFAVLPDCRFVLSGSSDNTLRLWDLQTGKTINVLEGNTDWVTACAALPDGRYVLSGSNDGILRLWDLQINESSNIYKKSPKYQQNYYISKPRGGLSKGAISFTIHPDGHHFLLSESRFFDYNSVFQLWDIETEMPVRSLKKGGGLTEWQVTTNIWLPDGHHILSGLIDGTLRLWNFQTGKTVFTLKEHIDYTEYPVPSISDCKVLPDGRYALVGHGHTLRLWDLQSRKVVRVLERLGGIGHFEVSQNGRYVLFNSSNNVEVYDLQENTVISVLEGHSNWVRSYAILTDNCHALTCFQDKTMRLWNLQTGKIVRIWEGFSDFVDRMSVLPDGCHILMSCGLTLQLWNMETGNEIARWTHDTHLEYCCVHSSKPLIVAVDSVGRIHFLRIAPSPLGPPTLQSPKVIWTPKQKSFWHFW